MRRALASLLLSLCALIALAPAAAASSFEATDLDPAITIADSFPAPTKASVYPSTVNLRGISGIAGIKVKLNSLSHQLADDLDILLVSPSGKMVLLMGDCGGTSTLTSLNLTFDDAAGPLPDSSLFFSGTYKPTNYPPAELTFPAFAPPGAANAGSSLAVNLGDDPNGAWHLFIVDDTNNSKAGTLTSWTLHIDEPSAPANDDFANAQAITGALPQSVAGTCFGATAQTGEPTHADYDTPDFSVWYSWTAPASGEVVVETSAVTFNTVLGVYTGTAVDQLTEVAFNNEKPGETAHESGLIFAATSGTTYFFKVDGYNGYTVGNFTLDVHAPNPPTIAATASASGTAGTPFTYTVDAQEYPTSFAATGLPPGLAIDGATGVISGTPTDVGTYPVAVHVANSAGGADQTLTITITAPPAITSPLYASGLVGQPFSYTITATRSPTSFSIASTWDTLPSGLTLDGGTGVISGTPTGTGYYWLDIRAGNADGTGKAKLRLWINDASAPRIVNPATLIGMVGVPMRFVLDGTNAPDYFDAIGLPPGLALDHRTIEGTPTTVGTWPVSVLVGNGSGTAVQNLTVVVTPAGTASSSGSVNTHDCGLGSPAVLLGLLGLFGWRRRRLIG